MLGIGFGEMVVIAVLVLIAVGPNKLPEMLKTVARTYRQFRRAAQDIRSSTGIDDFLRDEELKELAELRKQKLASLAMSKPAPKVAATGLTPEQLAEEQAALGKAPAPVLSKEQLSAKEAAIGKKIDVGGEGEGDAEHGPVAANAPFAKGGSERGLSYAQRSAERPPEGPDVAEAMYQRERAKAPLTRDGSADGALAETQAVPPKKAAGSA